MKRFIITNLLAILALPILACGWVETHNSYLFNAYSPDDFASRMEAICRNNWKAYLGLGETDDYYFVAEDVIKAAREKNDQLMVTYVQNLQKYLQCVEIEQRKQYEWDYPTKEEITQSRQTLANVRQYALGKTKSRLRSQHALLYMRCNMMLGEHAQNIAFWEQTASELINSVYKDMMMNIYAGALYKTGQEDKAGELFAEMGDSKSLMTQYYKRRSFAAIRQEYLKNPNAKVLPFLLQDFVNNAQEADDARNGNFEEGKLFIRALSEKEIGQMRSFCEQVVSEGKTETPVLWKSAKAWLEYMFGSKQQAVADIAAAMKMSGPERMMDNAHVLYLYINAATGAQDENFDDWLAQHLRWLSDKSANSEDWHYNRVNDRLVHQVLVSAYEQKGRPEISTAFLKAGGFDYYSYIDTMNVESLLRYEAYTHQQASTALDRYLNDAIAKAGGYEAGRNELCDLIGTKYMRIHQWEDAVKWLQQVPLSFYSHQGYAVYAHYRSTSVEPWIKRQFLKQSVEYSDARYTFTSNPKIDFAKEMLSMEGELNVLKGDAQLQRYYDLAVRFAQAHFTGDCWYLLRNAKSVGDTVRVNEFNFANRAVYYLKKASAANDFKLKEKACFALSYGGLYTQRWYEVRWSTEAGGWERVVYDWSPQYKAFSALAELERKNASRASQYVSRCDEYRQFLKNF